jgi:hypothetical protein
MSVPVTLDFGIMLESVCLVIAGLSILTQKYWWIMSVSLSLNNPEKKLVSQCYMATIPALRRLKQETWKFLVSLSYKIHTHTHTHTHKTKEKTIILPLFSKKCLLRKCMDRLLCSFIKQSLH